MQKIVFTSIPRLEMKKEPPNFDDYFGTTRDNLILLANLPSLVDSQILCLVCAIVYIPISWREEKKI